MLNDLSHLYMESNKAELIETESRMVVARGCCGGDGDGVGRNGICWSKGISLQVIR